MAENLADFLTELGGSPQFRAEPYYSGNGDCIIYHWRADESYRDRIDDKLTVYRSIATNEAVGCQIKGIRAIKGKLGDFGIALNETDGTPLAIFLVISQVVADLPEKDLEARCQMYKYLLEQVGKTKVELAASSD
jgi:hypothetical protein